MDDAMSERVRTLGNEFGATTGRPRRCGWFDAVVVRYATRINGLTDVAVTKLDVLDTLDRIAICTGYEYEGDLHTEVPGRCHRARRHRAAVRMGRGVAKLDRRRAPPRGSAGRSGANISTVCRN
jgi:adenylosuccinate synthase